MRNLRPLFLLFAVLVSPVLAEDYTHPGSGTWSDSAWNGGTTWVDGNTAVLTFTDSGTLTLDQNATVADVTASGTGTISGTANTLTFSGGNFSVDGGSTLTYGAKIAGSFTKTGDGTLDFTVQSNSGVSAVNITGGALKASMNPGFGGAIFGDAAVTVSNGATLQMAADFFIKNGTLTADGGNIYITGRQNYINTLVLKNGATLSTNFEATSTDNNSYRVGYNYASTAPKLTVSGETGSTINAGISMVAGNSPYTVEVGDTSSDVDLEIKGVIFDYPGLGGLGFKKTGAGALKLSGANTWGSGVQLTAGKLILGNTAAAGGGVLATSSGTSVQLSDAATFNVKGLTGPAAITADNASTLVIGSGVTSASVSEEFTGTFGSNITVQKEGAGTFIISTGQQTYAGLVVNGGVVKLNTPPSYGQQAQGNTPITINSGAKLDVVTNYAIKGSPITVDGGTLHNSSDEAYINSVTLKNGALVSASGAATGHNPANTIRVGNNYGTGANPVWTVAGTTGSTISANISLVAHGSTEFTLNVGDTNDDVDLTMTGYFVNYDFANASAIPVKKTGAGTLRLTNGDSIFGRGLIVDAGVVQLAARQAAGYGTVTVNGGKLQVLAPSEGGASDGIYRVMDLAGTGTVAGPTNANTPATLQFGAILNQSNQLVSTDFTFAGNFTGAGLILEKIGTSTVTLSKSGGSSGLKGVNVTSGTLVLAGGGFGPTQNQYGYFGQAPITVSDGATLTLGAGWQIQSTPLILDGENAKLDLSSGAQTYANNTTLLNGGDVYIGAGQYRIGYFGAGSTVLKVTGDSEISSDGGKFLIVSTGNAIEKYKIQVGGTGEEGESDSVLTISALIADHPNSNNAGKMVKTGNGTLILSNPGNTFKNGLEIEAGNVVIAPGAEGTGAITLTGNSIITPMVTGSENYTNLRSTDFPAGTALNLELDSATDFSRFTFTEVPTFDEVNGFITLDYEPALASPGSSYKVSDMTLAAGDLENWLMADYRDAWNLISTGSGIFLSADGNSVPEPSAWLILLLGIPMILRRRCKR
ncbi:MAG: autotransporter-associated beta strand repeat-containing protein [Thermoguttaceae bacterium]|nr:autotransporter-associated beta strand repeat-containing protein [Thermoguttaceae bacterium]